MLNFIKTKVSKIKMPKFSFSKKEKKLCDECNMDIPVITEVQPSSPYRDASPPDENIAKKPKVKRLNKKLILRFAIIGGLTTIPVAILSFMFPLTFGKFVVIFGTGLLGSAALIVGFLILSKIIKALYHIMKTPYHVGLFFSKRFNINFGNGVCFVLRKELTWLLGAAPILLPVSIYIFGKIILSSLLSLFF